MNDPMQEADSVSGEFVTRAGERYYAIRHVDKMPPFFINLVSESDHWLFISSNGGLTAGRISPETALFPYVSDDKIQDSTFHTGSKTIIRVGNGNDAVLWEPFNSSCHARYRTSRNLYKNTLGNKLCFEEINHDLGLTFRYSWMFSDPYGFIRYCELENHTGQPVDNINMVDGLQNILPAGTPRQLQTESSNLVDAYKWSELETNTGLAVFTLYSGITDRPQPCESLKANTVFSLGLEKPCILLSSNQLDNFLRGDSLQAETLSRGIRGAYLINTAMRLEPDQTRNWLFVADVEQSQAQVIRLRNALLRAEDMTKQILESVEEGSDGLQRLIGSADGFQSTAEEKVTLHHYANVLFNSMRGGVFDEQYLIKSNDLMSTVRHFNSTIYRRNRPFLHTLPQKVRYEELLSKTIAHGDFQLERLVREYLPVTFGRRHGDPSRPWNQFAIRLKDREGNRILSYQGNWRDIFQNWEALSLSYPEFIESVIAKFVNASTADGYNPYRITKEGIDWEIEDPEDPWSYIGYWGDHQIIYLLKLLEHSHQFHPDRLRSLLYRPVYCYANVPYRIKPFASLLQDSKNTVDYVHDLADEIAQRVDHIGADGKLLLDDNAEVYLVNLLEKLLVPLLAKLGNLIVGGGIWLNTQRPEWNDANNAIVGQGSSMVTMYYLRRYLHFLDKLISEEHEEFELSSEVASWLRETGNAITEISGLVSNGMITDSERFESLSKLGKASAKYRESLYHQSCFSNKIMQKPGDIRSLISAALVVIDYSIKENRRDDGLYHAYNLISHRDRSLSVDHLYPMLEGQVSVLSSGAIPASEAVSLLEALFNSQLYRPDQQTFLLYPDRELSGFLEKNRIPSSRVAAIPLLNNMLKRGDERLIVMDEDGGFHFNPDLINNEVLDRRLASLDEEYGREVADARNAIFILYEEVFNHREFTGRSGGMFGFEGLGCIYWHMVSKLLLASQESFFAAIDDGVDEATCHKLGELYYRIRNGIGFNKSPADYGAFPTDPYSHTPGHAGARQPGMTGQVKEEIITRFGELGIRVNNGRVSFQPALLRPCEFRSGQGQFRFLDVNDSWQEIALPDKTIAFTWCQLPIVYALDDSATPGVVIEWHDDAPKIIDGLSLSAQMSREIFMRSGKLRQLTVKIDRRSLFGSDDDQANLSENQGYPLQLA